MRRICLVGQVSLCKRNRRTILEEEKQMMKEQSFSASSNKVTDWKAINWPKVRRDVRRLQLRIAKAIRAGRYAKAKALSWLLTHSRSAKLLAVERVTENKGAKTPGVDNVKWRTDRQKYAAVQNLKRRHYRPLPLRRHYIPKKNGKLRPLSIPTLGTAPMQALHALALKPIAETVADRNSYGFREGRSCADAIWSVLLCAGQKLRAGLGARRGHQGLL